MNINEVEAITKDGIKSVIKQAWDRVNSDEIDTALYEAIIDTLCHTHGTEYIAECFVEMTKAGELA